MRKKIGPFAVKKIKEISMSEHIPAGVQSAFERSQHPFHMWDGIQSIPDGLEDILLTERVRSNIRAAAQAMLGKSSIHLVGCGTSYFACVAGTYLFHGLSGCLSTSNDAFEFYAYPPARLAESVVIGISHTGTTKSVIQALDLARQRQAVTIAITDGIDSAIEGHADVSIPSSLGIERSLPKTRSFLASVMRTYLLAVELARLQGKVVSELEALLLDSPRVARLLLAGAENPMEELAHAFKTLPRRIVVVGAGPQLASAMEGSLKLTEAALMNSLAIQAEEFAHGAWYSVQESDLIILLAAQGRSFEKINQLNRAMQRIGARTWLITNGPQ
jgi:glutamine---fructose-6-phosphate transaminase (isomerizing)